MIRGQHACFHLPRSPFEVAARAEQNHGRRLHRRGDVHGHGIHADETFRLPGERRELLEVELAAQVRHGTLEL